MVQLPLAFVVVAVVPGPEFSLPGPGVVAAVVVAGLFALAAVVVADLCLRRRCRRPARSLHRWPEPSLLTEAPPLSSHLISVSFGDQAGDRFAAEEVDHRVSRFRRRRRRSCRRSRCRPSPRRRRCRRRAGCRRRGTRPGCAGGRRPGRGAPGSPSGRGGGASPSVSGMRSWLRSLAAARLGMARSASAPSASANQVMPRRARRPLVRVMPFPPSSKLNNWLRLQPEGGAKITRLMDFGSIRPRWLVRSPLPEPDEPPLSPELVAGDPEPPPSSLSLEFRFAARLALDLAAAGTGRAAAPSSPLLKLSSLPPSRLRSRRRRSSRSPSSSRRRHRRCRCRRDGRRAGAVVAGARTGAAGARVARALAGVARPRCPSSSRRPRGRGRPEPLRLPSPSEPPRVIAARCRVIVLAVSAAPPAAVACSEGGAGGLHVAGRRRAAVLCGPDAAAPPRPTFGVAVAHLVVLDRDAGADRAPRSAPSPCRALTISAPCSASIRRTGSGTSSPRPSRSAARAR